jgi:hypothetical protein
VHEWSFRDLGFTGNIVIPTRVISDGTRFTGEATLNIGDLMCIGGCATNPTTRYTVPLASIGGTPTGTATLQVSWVQGNSNGLARPIVSEVPQRGDALEISDSGIIPWAQPMMDTDERMSYSGVDSASLSGIASLHLITDRPTDYRVSLEALRGEHCAVGGGTLEVSGHTEGATDVDIPGLCFGTFYWATVELTDEYGTTNFSASRGGVTQWLASLVARLLVVANHLIDDEAQEFFGKFRIEIGVLGQPAEARDLALLAARIGRGQLMLRLVRAHRLGHLESFGQHMDQRGIDIVDALTITAQPFVAHARPPKAPFARGGILRNPAPLRLPHAQARAPE